MDADDIVHLKQLNYDVKSWTTSSTFDNITNLEAVFKKDPKTKTTVLTSTNPGTIYLNLLVENNEDHSISPILKIILPDAENSQNETVHFERSKSNSCILRLGKNERYHAGFWNNV